MTSTSDLNSRRASVDTLPRELFDNVLQFINDVPTFKVLRITGTCHDDLITRRLFSRVGLSILKSSVVSIAACPRLAQHVRALVWHELAPLSDSLISKNAVFVRKTDTSSPSCRPDPRAAAEAYRERERLWVLAKAACWITMPEMSNFSPGADRHRDPLEGHRDFLAATFAYFCEWFVPAVDKMPSLDMFTLEHRSRFPKLCIDPHDGEFVFATLPYRLFPGAGHRWSKRWELDKKPFLDIFADYIRQTIARHVDRQLPPDVIRTRARLAYIDGGPRRPPVPGSLIVTNVFRPPHWTFVAAIRELRLAVDRISVVFMRDLLVALASASHLTKLKIKSTTGTALATSRSAAAANTKGEIVLNVGSFVLEHCTVHSIRFRSLKDLHLQNLDFTVAQLNAFIGLQRDSLRSVRLEDCSVGEADLLAMQSPASAHDGVKVVAGLEARGSCRPFSPITSIPSV